MSTTMLTPHPDLVNKFVTAKSGAELHAAGGKLCDCLTPTQRNEWIAVASGAELYDAYQRASVCQTPQQLHEWWNRYENGRQECCVAMSLASDYGPDPSDDYDVRFGGWR